MFEFRSAMNQKAMGLANDLDPEEQNEFRAKGLHVNAFWSAKYHGTPVMKKEAVLSAVCLVGDSSDGIVVSSLEDLMNFAVADNGRTRPLVDADTFLAYAEKDPAVAKTYLQSKLVEAFDRKMPVFYRSRLTGETLTCSLERGDEGDLTVHGKDINKSIRGVERPSFYLFKRIVNYFSKGTYPEVTKYQKRLRAESAKEYFEKTADTRREKYAAYNEKVRQTKEAGKATLKEYAATHETVRLTPSNGFTHEHLICPSSRLNEIVTSYEEKFGPLSDDFKSSLHDLHESAVNDEEILRANSVCEKPFSAEAEVKSVLACRTVVSAMERGQLSPSLVTLVTENKMNEVLAGDGNLSYFTDHAHAGSFYLENLLDAAKIGAAGEKVVQGAERVAAKEAMLEAAKAQKLNAPERQAAEKAVSKPDLAPQMP